MINDPPEGYRAFTDAVYRAEGLDPETADRHLYRRILLVVQQAFRDVELREEEAWQLERATDRQ